MAGFNDVKKQNETKANNITTLQTATFKLRCKRVTNEERVSTAGRRYPWLKKKKKKI